MKHKVAILLATYNRSHFLSETLDSILNQTHRNWDCLIVDDHSEDYTEELVSFYLEKDRRFSYFKKTEKYKRGLSGTRNYGLDLAEQSGAEFIQFFDDDDIMHPRKLELQLEPFLLNSRTDMTLCQYRKFFHKSTIELDLDKADDGLCNIQTENLLKSFYLNELNLNSSGPVWKAKALGNRRFLEDLFFAEEKEYYLRVFYEENINYVPVRCVLFWYRKHDQAITSNLYNNPIIKLSSVKVFEKKFLNTVLQKKKAPYFLLKSYTVRSLKNGNLSDLTKISRYIKENYNPLELKVYMLLLYIKMKTFGSNR